MKRPTGGNFAREERNAALSEIFFGGPIVQDEENADAIDALRRRLTNNANVIPFIGAGLSRPFGYPAWREFLQKGADQVGKRNEVDNLIDQGDYEYAMTVIHGEMEGIRYSDFLRNTFDSRQASVSTWNAAARFLPAMPETPIVTTNIDGALEQVFAEHGSPLEVIVGARRDRIRLAIEEKQRCLVKLHGDYRDSFDRILTLEDYEKHYGSQTRAARKRQPFQGIVQNLLAGNSFLFLGFGMEDRTKKLLQSVAEGGGLHSHWIVLPRSPQRAYGELARELGRSNVRTLWYDEGRYEHIGAFLHWYACTAAPAGSLVHRFYSAIAEKNYSAALKFGQQAIDDGQGDPALIWNVSTAREYAARELLAQGKLPEGLQLLGQLLEKHIKGRSDGTQSAMELQWALSFALKLPGGAGKPAHMSESTVETLGILREALDNPRLELPSSNSYQQASRNGIADVLQTFRLLDQTYEAEGNEVEVLSTDSLIATAWQAREAQRSFSDQAAKAESRFRIIQILKRVYYQNLAGQEEVRLREARRALIGRKVTSLIDAEARMRWYEEH